MPKSFSTACPSKVERYDHNHFILAFNIVEVEATESREAGFEFETIVVEDVSKPAIVEAIVRDRFSVSDELGLLRQRDSKKAEFDEYNNFVEAAKATADTILADE